MHRSYCKLPDVFARFQQNFGISRYIFVEVPSIKFNINPIAGSHDVTCGQKDRRTNSLTPFQSKRASLCRFNVADNNKTYLCCHVNCPILNKFGYSRQIFFFLYKSPIIKFQGNLSSEGRADTCRQTEGRTDRQKTDRRTDMKKVIDTLRLRERT